MAKARMLHNKISLSLQVNRLSLEAQLLFTWLISHADDEGRLKGEPEYVKATVIPMKTWTFEEISIYIKEIETQKLIYYWEDEDRTVIQLIKWKEHQIIRGDRFKESLLPPYSLVKDTFSSTNRQPNVSQPTAQDKLSEQNAVEIKKSENESVRSLKDILEQRQQTNLTNVIISSKEEAAALYAWKALEPDNKSALQTTYLNAVRKGVKADMIYQWVSEIKQDRSIKNPGQVFNARVKDYTMKEDDKS